MGNMEWLFLGFWACHSCEWAYGTFLYDNSYRKRGRLNKRLETRRLKKEIKYWENTATRSQIELNVSQMKLKEYLKNKLGVESKINAEITGSLDHALQK